MRNIELYEKLKNHFEWLEAYIEQRLGSEKLEALSKIIYFNDVEDIPDIVDNDRFNYDYNFNFKNWASTQDYINAFKILLDDEDLADVKDYLKDLPFYQGEITDDILEMIFNNDYDGEFYRKLNEIKEFTKTIMGEKYYNFFTRDFIENFLGE